MHVKVLQIVDSLNVGGAETIVVEFVDTLLARGDAVEVAYFTDGPYRARLEAAGVSCHRLSWRGLRGPSVWWRTFRLIRNVRPDVVHTHLVKSDVVGQIAAFAARVDVRVLTVHNTPPWLERRRYRVIYRTVLVAATDVIACGSGVEAHLRSLDALPAGGVVTIENGIDTDRFVPVAPDPGGSPMVIGAVGRLEPQKDHATLIRAVAEMIDRGVAVRLEIFGDGSERRALDELIVSLGVTNQVELAGLSPEIEAAYRRFDVLAFSSRYEGLPMALLEGMACGLPIVSTAVGTVPDVVTDGEHGLLVPTGDSRALADALTRLAHEPAERTRMGTAARRAVEDRYSSTRFHRRMLELYERRRGTEIVMVTTLFSPIIGGAELMIEALARGLAERGHAVTVVTRQVDPCRPRVEQMCDGVTVRRIPVFGGPPLASLTFTVGAAVRLLPRYRHGVVHAHQLFSPLTVGWILTRRRRTHLVATPHRGGGEGDVSRLSLRRSGRARLRRLGRDVDVFTSISTEIREELESQGVPAAKIRNIPNGIDVDRFRPPAGDERERMRRELCIAPDAAIIGFIGRLELIKGVDLLLAIGRRRPDLTIVIAGVGSLDADVRACAAKYPNVIVLGARTDVEYLLRALDVWTLPSRGEGLPLSLLEAMSSAVPVVTTPVGAIPEVITHGVNGLLADVDDDRALEAAFDQALGTDGADLGRRARRTVIDRYSHHRMVDGYEAIYRELDR